MINYNDQHNMWKQRLTKEMWSKDELANFGHETDAAFMQSKYGVGQAEKQKMYMSSHFPKASKEKAESDGRSQWSRIEPDPKLQNEKLIWKSKLYGKNQIMRKENAAVGTLGQYSIGDLDMVVRLDKKLKEASSRRGNSNQVMNSLQKFRTPLARQTIDLTGGKEMEELA